MFCSEFRFRKYAIKSYADYQMRKIRKRYAEAADTLFSWLTLISRPAKTDSDFFLKMINVDQKYGAIWSFSQQNVLRC
jgi:hypothetical protein